MVDKSLVNISIRSDRKLQKKVLTRGDCKLYPREEAKVQVRITQVTFKDAAGPRDVDSMSNYLRSDFSGRLNVGDADYYIDEDFEHCLQTMSRGETSIFYFEYNNPKGKLGQSVSCEVELLDTTNELLVSDWDWARLYKLAERHKNRGVELVHALRITDAFRRFSRAYKLIVSIEQYNPEEIPSEKIVETEIFKIKILNNLAHCQLHYGEYKQTIDICNKVLSLEKKNVRALYRRGAAHMGLDEWEEAYRDIQNVLKLEPKNKDALTKLEVIKPKFKVIMDNYTSTVKKMFG